MYTKIPKTFPGVSFGLPVEKVIFQMPAYQMCYRKCYPNISPLLMSFCSPHITYQISNSVPYADFSLEVVKLSACIIYCFRLKLNPFTFLLYPHKSLSIQCSKSIFIVTI